MTPRLVLARMVVVIALGAGTAAASDLPAPLADVVSSAAAEGLPTEPLEAKAREGLAKGVPVARITVVLEGLRSELDVARSALGGDAEPAVVTAAGHALRSGAGVGAVQRVAFAPHPRRDLALVSLGDLMHAGLPEERAVELVETASAAPQTERAFTGLAVTSSALLEAGMSADTVTRVLGDAVRSGEDALDMARVPGSGMPSHAMGQGNQPANPPGKSR